MKDVQLSPAQTMLTLKFVRSICGFRHPITLLNEHQYT